MTTTKTTQYTVRCDVGSHCQDEHQNPEHRTVRGTFLPDVYAILRREGWQIGGNYSYAPAMCPYCVKKVNRP